MQKKAKKNFVAVEKQPKSVTGDDEKPVKYVPKKPKRKATTSSTDVETTIKKYKSEKHHLYKQPTVEELNHLRETENLFHSNLFRLQIEEMLTEIRIKEKRNKFIQSWLDEFNGFLEKLEDMPEKVESTDSSWLKTSKIKIPLKLDHLQQKPFQFQFLKPTEKAFLVGSAETNSLIEPNFMVDVCVSMPAKCFQKENYLNLIYDQKRALYLTFIASRMIENGYNATELSFNYFQNNIMKPVLEISPANKKFKLRILVVPEQDSFKLNRFVPWNSNIRQGLFEKTATSDEIPLATPNYNATILSDLTMKRNQTDLDNILKSHKNLREGLILLKIWLRQRSLDIGFSGFSGHLMAMFLAYLFKERKIQASMSSYQIARNVWNHLGISKWDEEGITLCKASSSPNQPTMEQFHVHFDLVFVDFTGFNNLAANLSLDLYLRLKYECQRAIQILDNTKINSFQQLFIVKIPIYSQYDNIFAISNFEEILKEIGVKADLHNFAGYKYPQFLKMITEILRKGLSQRIISMTPIESPSTSWNLTKIPKSTNQTFQIGLVLNPEHAFEMIEKGPQANDPEAENFRQFWGEKSQLRRFQDGSITESCVWCPSNVILSEKRLIVKKIVHHLLKHHFEIQESQINYFANEFDDAYKLNKILYVFEDVESDAETTSFKVIESFNEVAKHLRAIDDLPLDINFVQGISPVFRYCDPLPILPQGSVFKQDEKRIFQSYSVCRGIIHLGMSGKWPSDVQAFRRIKAAFHLQIAKSLRKQFELEARGDVDSVTVLKDGFVFQVEIAHTKEIALLKKEVTEKGITQYVDTPVSLNIEKRFNIMPKITSALHGLYQTFPSFGPCVMIAKRWLYSQMIDTYLWPDECTELLIASQYLTMGAIPNPSQPQTGFFRFLHLLATTDWRNEVFFINFNDEMEDKELTTIENKFHSERETFPTVSIITSYDLNKDSIWTKEAPSMPVLARVSLLARTALNIIESALIAGNPLNVADFMLPSLEGYDILINIRKKMIHTCSAYDFEPTPRSGKQVDTSVPAAGFNPVEKCLAELREAYSEHAVFFHNPCGGKVIAVIWKPDIFTEKEFKVANINSRRLTPDGKIVCDISQFLEDFKVIARGLYFTIDDLRSTKHS